MYRFHDKKIDTQLFVQLQDFAAVLSRDPDLTFEYSYGSAIDVFNHTVSASTFWEDNDASIQVAGYKTDILLRTIGNLHFSDIQIMRDFYQRMKSHHLPGFAEQLFTMLENMRLEMLIIDQRPGTERLFTTRGQFLRHYFITQLRTNVTRGYVLDELLSLIYLLITSNQPDPSFPDASREQLKRLEGFKTSIFSIFEARSTRDITFIVDRMLMQLDDIQDDIMNTYFIFPVKAVEQIEQSKLFDELTRTDPLENDDNEEVDEDKSEYIDETFSTWHRENKNEDRNQTFLQFDLEQGTKTSLLGGGTRETEDGDQAMAAIQGASGQSEQKDYSDLETLDKQEEKETSQAAAGLYGEENRHASIHKKHAKRPTESDKQQYADMIETIDPIKRKLAKTIENTLEHKQNMPRDHLAMGRLSKNLLPLVLEDNPKIFYKKDHESNEIDAAFTLLVDCSASMQNKMDETKLGITLFHEVLRQLHIPHAIIGFWEDAVGAKDEDQPNYFHIIHSHDDSLYQSQGARIMQLEPQEDNRDGFSIRVAAEKLAARREQHKFLLVFSDGEPAAMNYEDNGIVDTHQAVTEARKKGIDVIGMFLANDQVQEGEEKLMDNIYGKQRIMVPHIDELPEQFAPLLKKLILKAL